MTRTTPNRPYAERYCAHHNIPPDQFTPRVLAHSLHAPLRWAWPVLGWCWKETYALERTCVTAVGSCTQRDEVYRELSEYGYHPDNAGFWRRRMRQRLSTRRLLKLMGSLPK